MHNISRGSSVQDPEFQQVAEQKQEQLSTAGAEQAKANLQEQAGTDRLHFENKYVVKTPGI